MKKFLRKKEPYGCLWIKGLLTFILKSGKTISRDLHLQVDFFDTETMQRLHALFDKVVVDRSTYKFFASQADKEERGLKEFEEVANRLMALLRPGGTLICDFNIESSCIVFPPGSPEEEAMLRKIAISQAARLVQLQTAHNNENPGKRVEITETKGCNTHYLRRFFLEEEASREKERTEGRLLDRWSILSHCNGDMDRQRDRFLAIKGYLNKFFCTGRISST